MRRFAARTPAGTVFAASIAVTMGLAGSCRTLPKGQIPALSVPSTAGASAQPEDALVQPIVRVGILPEVPRVSIGADGGLILRTPDGALRPMPRATFVGVAPGGTPAQFRVQVASLTDEGAARGVAERAQRLSGLEPQVRWSEETRTHQVRLGSFATREEAQALVAHLEQGGLRGGWIVEEPAVPGVARVKLLETGEELPSADLVAARTGDFLAADDVRYRGFLRVRAGDGGTVTVINVLNLEDYVRGVVPNELSPVVFPQIEALKAQAVAARTYTLRNMGLYAGRGYDICATPACQMYRGQSSEHPLSTQAVEDTAGVVGAYGGGLINALYTSTCGGHTEDVENIFEGNGEPAPYLRGVACVPEQGAWTTIRTARAPVSLGEPERLGRDAALLVSLGVLEPRHYSRAALAGAATADELKAWVSRLVTALHRQPCPGASEGALPRRGAFFRDLVASVCWNERAARLLAPGDRDYLLQVEDRDALADEERTAAALLVQEGILAPFPDNTLRPDAALLRADAVTLLAETAVRAGAPALQSATLREARAGRLTIEREEVPPEELPLDPGLRLFRALDGNRMGASELHLISGERVRYVLQEGRVGFLEAEQSRLGATNDRSSRVFRWEVRLTPDELSRAIARYGSVGTVRDVKPLRVGVSGRVVEAAILGTDGELMLKGLQVRWGLGLRENLFVIDRERAPDGHVARFIFTGKGWGHGVGLCQVGASGMAQQGASFEQILSHYYRGVRIRKTS
ncbi:MAG TPA: SpoIID/LytB domain-containing protein [Vicinamibacteria bacterium]